MQRELQTLDTQLGGFTLSLAAYSWGDVWHKFERTDDKDRFIVMDTIGKSAARGERTIRYLQHADEHMPRSDIETEIAWLSGNITDDEIRDGVFCYYQFTRDQFSMVSGGFQFPIMVTKDGGMHSWMQFGSYLDQYIVEPHPTPRTTTLLENEVLFIMSDGVVENPMVQKDYVAKHTALLSHLRDLRTETPSYIRDSILKEHGPSFIPRDKYMDDVTLAIVKRSE